VCHMQTLHRWLSGHQKRHCSGAFRSHDMIYGLSEALRALAILYHTAVFKCRALRIEPRYLVCTLNLDMQLKMCQGARLLAPFELSSFVARGSSRGVTCLLSSSALRCTVAYV
jgi:hypothetical protein